MDLSKHLEKAEEARKRRNYPLAIGLYQQILDLDPDMEGARKGLREALDGKFEGKRGGGPLAWIQGFLPLLSASIAKLSKGHAARAKNLERYLALAPSSVSANLGLGEALENGGYYKSAFVVYEAIAKKLSAMGKAGSQVQSACFAWRRAGALAAELGRLDEAMQCYDASLQLNARDQEALRARKNLAAQGVLESTGFHSAGSSRDLLKDAQQQRSLEQAQRIQRDETEVVADLESLERQLADSPDDSSLLRHVGSLRAEKGDVAAALDCLERALTLEPSDFKLITQVGDLRIREVEQQIEKARKLGDQASVSRLEGQKLSLAIEEAKRRVRAYPTDLGLKHALGLLLLEAGMDDPGKLDEAIAELQKSVKDPRHTIEARIGLGRAFREKKFPDLARSQLEQALEAAGSNHERSLELHYELGLLAEAEGRGDDARTHFARILENDISFRDVSQRMGAL